MAIWWLVALKVLVTFAFLIAMTLFVIVFERKVVARMQVRPGPNRAGPNGWLQSLADGLKLILKEDLRPRRADAVVYAAAPVIAVVCAFTAFAVIPLGPTVSVFGHRTALQLADPPVGVLVALACSAMGVYGVVLSGYAGGSTYPLIGAIRSAAQMISYEAVASLSIAAVLLVSGSLRTSDIVARQAHGHHLAAFGGTLGDLPSWNAIVLLPSFLSFFISAVGETNRAPFDLVEAESELVGGFHTEYSSVKFMLLYLAEYVNVITLCALCTTLYLGGWRAPWPLSAAGGALNQGWWPPLWFIAKVLALVFVFIWLRATLPRFRYDQYMRFSWKLLLPVNLAWLVLLAGLRVPAPAPVRWLILGCLAVLVAAIVAAWPRRRTRSRPAPVGHPATGGYPLPPMDLVVPPSPRRTGGGRGSTGAEPGLDAVQQPR